MERLTEEELEERRPTGMESFRDWTKQPFVNNCFPMSIPKFYHYSIKKPIKDILYRKGERPKNILHWKGENSMEEIFLHIENRDTNIYDETLIIKDYYKFQNKNNRIKDKEEYYYKINCFLKDDVEITSVLKKFYFQEVSNFYQEVFFLSKKESFDRIIESLAKKIRKGCRDADELIDCLHLQEYFMQVLNFAIGDIYNILYMEYEEKYRDLFHPF